ncbi:MAG TPA: BMA_0021/BMA_0022 family TOMM bacteriocin, partial [Kofleriaceae bacterium]|nr:BMA_0021/BMA_0022 family TOMM bacteriocin [Kofleriaceae bacterium]
QFIEALKSNTMQALQRYFNYQSPFTVDLELQPTRQGKWVSAQMVDGKPVPGHWADLPPNELVFNVPTKPEPIFEEAIAAAEYIDSGPNYLFSCC